MKNIKDKIKVTKHELYANGIVRENNKWQGIEVEQRLWEIFNYHFSMTIPESRDELAEQTKANLPWAEAHFQERVGGFPLNPGNEYKNWPFYKGMDNDKEFRQDGDGEQFSHSYMERMWCKLIEPELPESESRKGIRYEYGDFDDFIRRIKENPYGRQNYFSIWHPEDQSLGDRRLPCTLGYWFNIVNNELFCTYHIRSCDIFRHFHNDIYMTGRLMHYVRDELKSVIPDLKMGLLHMWIGSLHCFEIEKEMLVYKV